MDGNLSQFPQLWDGDWCIRSAFRRALVQSAQWCGIVCSAVLKTYPLLYFTTGVGEVVQFQKVPMRQTGISNYREVRKDNFRITNLKYDLNLS